jgi:hypothetical protein
MPNKHKADEQDDMLMELVSHPGWQILKMHLQNTINSKVSKLIQPAEKEFDLVGKEAESRSVRALRSFFEEVEQRTEAYAKQVQRGA